MGRHQQPQIAEQILDACTDHALAEGLPDRLDPFVQATGTSARMLLYHFGTRDALLRAVLRRARQRQITYFREWLRARPGENYTTTLARAWKEMTGPNGQPYLGMFSQLRENTAQTLWPGFRRIATTDWIEPLEEGLSTIGRPDSATLVLAVIRGLLIDRDSTAEYARTDRAFHEFLITLSPNRPTKETPSTTAREG